MAQRGREDASPSAAGGPVGRQDLGGFGQVVLERNDRRPEGVDELGVAQDVAEHRFGALVVGVELRQCVRQPLLRVADRTPGREVGPRVRA